MHLYKNIQTLNVAKEAHRNSRILGEILDTAGIESHKMGRQSFSFDSSRQRPLVVTLSRGCLRLFSFVKGAVAVFELGTAKQGTIPTQPLFRFFSI